MRAFKLLKVTFDCNDSLEASLQILVLGVLGGVVGVLEGVVGVLGGRILFGVFVWFVRHFLYQRPFLRGLLHFGP